MLGAARDVNHFAFQQRGKHAVHGHAAHRFDLRAPDGLTVGDDGQRFQRGLAEPRRLGLIQKLVGPDRELGPGLQHVASSDSLRHQTGTIGGQASVQLLDGSFNFCDGDFFAGGGFGRGRKLHRLMQDMHNGFRG